MNFIELQNTDKCTNCFKCVQHCFTKAISVNKDENLVEIDYDLCVKCGLCTKSCKADIPYVQTNYEKVEELISNGEKVYLILDSLYLCEFTDITLNKMKKAGKSIGFEDVYENFTGFALHRYISHKHFIETNKATIETFCITFNNFVAKFYPNLTKYMSPAPPPEDITSRLIKEEFGTNIYTVYATTCFAQEEKNTIYDCDLIISVSELEKIFNKHNINLNNIEASEEKYEIFYFTPPESEIVETIESCTEMLDYLKNNDDYSSHILPYWCDSCFSSPVFTKDATMFERKRNFYKHKNNSCTVIDLTDENVSQFGDLSRFTFKLQPNPAPNNNLNEEDIQGVLALIGRDLENGHFDCGACGYTSCRDFAKSILLGKSTEKQCIPHVSTLYEKGLQELDAAFKLTIPNSRLEKKLKNTKEFKDEYIKESGKIKIIDIYPDGTYKHVINCLKIAADFNNKGVMSVIGFDKDALVKTIIFHDIGKSQPALKIGDEVYPKEIFEDGKLHAERSAELARANYSEEGITDDIYNLIKYHHHSERELPSDFPSYLLPMYRLFRIIDGISAGLTRRKNTITFEIKGSVLYIKEISQNPNFNKFYSIDLYKPEYLKKEYDFNDDLEVILKTTKYKK